MKLSKILCWIGNGAVFILISRLSDQFAKCTKKYQRYTKLVKLASKERL